LAPEQNGLNNLTQSFDIKVEFGDSSEKNSITINSCYIISRGQTVQISDQVILEEYGFIAREFSGDLKT
jgi:hypothetical protein